MSNATPSSVMFSCITNVFTYLSSVDFELNSMDYFGHESPLYNLVKHV